MSVNKFFPAIFVAFLAATSFSQNNGADSLAKFGIYNFPSKSEVDPPFFNSEDLTLTKIITEDINSDFSNISDLNWLQSPAKQNKVMLIGETHYSTFIHNMRNRILFAVNKFDYYPLLILEQQYSFTPYVNYFLNTSDDIKAKDYYNTAMSRFVKNVEDSILFEHIRKWNKINKDKKIEIGFSDMEWDNKTTFNYMLKPYFMKLPNEKISLDSLFDLGLTEEFISGIENLWKKADALKLVGEYPFITSAYIKNVISNLKYTSYCMKHSFDYYRQKGIIHNLTDENVFGKFFKSSKVLMHGGGQHTTTKVKFPFEGNFLTEGSFLTNDFLPTRGKTYSLMLEGMAFQLGSMSNVDVSKTFAGDQYKSILRRMKKAYAAGLLKSDRPYFMFNQTNDLVNFILYCSYKYDASALLLNSVNWNGLMKKAANRADLAEIIKAKKSEVVNYDSYIFIPYSPIEVLRANK